MIKFFNYKTKKISEIFEGFTILSEEELEDRIQKSPRKRLNVYGGGCKLKIDFDLKNFTLVSDYISSGALFSPVSAYSSEFDPKNKKDRVIFLWFTSLELAKIFIKKFYNKKIPYTGDLNKSRLIVLER